MSSLKTSVFCGLSLIVGALLGQACGSDSTASEEALVKVCETFECDGSDTDRISEFYIQAASEDGVIGSGSIAFNQYCDLMGDGNYQGTYRICYIR